MGEVSGWVAEETGYNRDTVTGYLDEKYKKSELATRIGDPNPPMEGFEPSSIIPTIREVVPVVDIPHSRLSDWSSFYEESERIKKVPSVTDEFRPEKLSLEGKEG